MDGIVYNCVIFNIRQVEIVFRIHVYHIYFFIQAVSKVNVLEIFQRNLDHFRGYFGAICPFQAMKCKQTIDLANVKSLTSLLEEFEGLYFGHSHPK